MCTLRISWRIKLDYSFIKITALQLGEWATANLSRKKKEESSRRSNSTTVITIV